MAAPGMAGREEADYVTHGCLQRYAAVPLDSPIDNAREGAAALAAAADWSNEIMPVFLM